MRILMSGAGGLIGAALGRRLAAAQHTVTRLVRSRPGRAGEFHWDPVAQRVDPTAFIACDAVIHLAGSSIGAGRWSTARKAEILASRRLGTRLIAASIARSKSPPSVLISASAVGFYGDRGDEFLNEDSESGAGFLAEVVRVWEEEAQPAAAAGVRVVHPRFGLILAREGGALAKLARPYHLGLGGPIGSGAQWVSWATLNDAIHAVIYALSHNALYGPVNVVSPRPVTQIELSRALGRALRRPAFLPLPASVIEVVLGQMGRELLLFSQRATPQRLITTGFAFEHPDIDQALMHVLRAGGGD